MQPSNAPFPTDVTFSESVTDVRDVHPLKAPSPIAVTDGGMLIDVSAVHPLKISAGTAVMPEGRGADVREVQPLNTPPARLTAPLYVTPASDVQLSKAFDETVQQSAIVTLSSAVP